jgi:predicted TIM-barrel fold metal-dependent hydrolase
VKPLLHKLAATHVQIPGAFGSDPVEQFQRHLWVSPFFEDDVSELVETVGADRVLFGSDWPHVEGLADPAAFVKELDGLSEAEIKSIMRDNTLDLLTPRPL